MHEDKNVEPKAMPEYEVPVVMPLGNLNRGEGIGCSPGSGNSICEIGNLASAACDDGNDGQSVP